jgi:large subunit ribosomal protein L20
MARVKRGMTAHARHKKILDLAKGYRGRAHSNYRIALQKVEKGLRYAYRDRRAKKRNFRALWIQRINAAVREHGLTYSQFMNGIHKAGIEIDRKVLSELAISESEAFKALVEAAQAAIEAAADGAAVAAAPPVEAPSAPAAEAAPAEAPAAEPAWSEAETAA